MLNAALLYVSVNSPGNVNFDTDVLTAGGFLSKDAAQCPSNGVKDYNDYSITVVNNHPTSITCKIKPADHAWTLP